MHVGALAIYPLKSGRQVLVGSMSLDRFGPAGDRRWMLVDDAGRFVTQRTHPRMCLLSAVESVEGLRLQAPGMPDIHVLRPVEGGAAVVSVWEDQVDARLAGPDADAWCSRFLGMPVRLVWMPESTYREVSPAHAGEGHTTGFSDGFPLLLATQSSLDLLNSQLQEPVDWRRFRPNIVVAGDLAPHAEDGWKRLRIGEVELAVVKPCSRCVIPSINPDTADKNGQILTVMRGYRAAADGKTYFGQNVIVVTRPEVAVIRVGDPVELLA
ncbi:MAG TPA: MOSC N-terminal beta barrel domain-containing protein [Candidatus Kapabacteria bacterium]|nr:MOSC N-terminal beta barrel domain-containing protein [Candidatus Kapabacteria bacterium]